MTDRVIHHPGSQAGSNENTGNEGLQRVLINFYRRHQSTISVSPIADDYEAPIVDFYVKPPMISVDIQHRFLEESPTKTPVTSYKQLLFSSQDKAFENIYLTADPGIGKTAFCKRLCTAWCQAHDPQEAQADKFSADDISALKHFEFLFYIPLREVGRQLCDVDAIVNAFINRRLSVSLTPKQMAFVLNEAFCLILLDGLDEWNHPVKCKHRQTSSDIPHRRHRPNNTVITTTRPWKFDIIQLPPSAVDSHIQMEKLTDMGSKELASNVVRFLNEVTMTDDGKSVEIFLRTSSTLTRSEIRSIPYIYTQCICLWFEGKSIGESRCQIYSNIVELTLKRATVRLLKLRRSLPDRQREDGTSLPSCLRELKYCLHYLWLLRKVCKVAFSSLFESESRQMLVIDAEFTSKDLTPEELSCCLKLGLLSQDKSYGSLTTQISNVSFSHKTLHEYFAALYIYLAGTSLDCERVQDIVVQKCSSSAAFIELSPVFIFLSGFDAGLYCELSRRMTATLLQDESICVYRQTVCFVRSSENPLAENFQNVQTDCAREMEQNGQEVSALPLQDLIINTVTKREENLTLIQKMNHEHSGNVKSLSITVCDSTEEVTHVLQKLNYNTFMGLQKLVLFCCAREEDVEQLLTKSQPTLQTLRLSNYTHKEDQYKIISRQLTQRCEELILDMPVLQSLLLGAFILEHVQIQRLAAFITSRNTMTEVGLHKIRCKEHNDSCAGVTLDLSQHENMEGLQLGHIPLFQLNLNTQRLSQCRIGKLPAAVVSSSLICLPATQHLHTLVCQNFCSETLLVLIDTIPTLKQLKRLHITDTDLGDCLLQFSQDMTKLELIYLGNVNLQSAVLQDLADTLIKHSLSVTVRLEDCTVTPQEDFQVLKENIASSEKFVRVWVGLSSNNSPLFQFKTNP